MATSLNTLNTNDYGLLRITYLKVLDAITLKPKF